MAKMHEKIAENLRRKIRAGELRPGDKLPAETALAGQYGVGLPTLRQALGVLQVEGLIEKRHGRGNFVRKRRPLIQRSNEGHQIEKDHARLAGTHRRALDASETGVTRMSRIEYREVEANEDLAAEFNVPVGSPLLERVYREEGAPFSISSSYLLLDMISSNPDLLDQAKEPWPGGTLGQLYTVGVEVVRIIERVTARPPTADESEELGWSVGIAVIALRKVSLDIRDRVVEVTDILFPGNRTELVFTTQLARWETANS